MSPRGTILVAEADVTPVLLAIDRAVARLQRSTNLSVTEYAKIALDELGHIAKAKQAYDATIAHVRPANEPEQIHAPQPLVLRDAPRDQ